MFNLKDAINPYWLYVKIGAVILAVCVVIGVVLYIRHVFNDRVRLQAENGRLAEKLTNEQVKYRNLVEQHDQIMEMNRKIVEAVRRVKVNSTIFIDKVEAARLAAPAVGGTVLVPGGLPKATADALPIFGNQSANRTDSDPS